MFRKAINSWGEARRMRSFTRNQKGFGSILEITLVCSVSATMAAVAVPSVNSAMKSYKLSMASQAVAQRLNVCRQRAVAANRPTSILVTSSLAQVDTNYNGIFGDAGGNGVPADEPPQMLGVAGCTVSPTQGLIVRTFTGRGELPLGLAPETQTITVEYSGVRRMVSIDPRGGVSVGAPF